MFSSGKSSFTAKRLDELGNEIVRTAADNHETADKAIEAPFLLARVRSRIESQRGAAADRDGWVTTVRIFWRAVPTMALVAFLALAFFVSSSFRSPVRVVSFNDESVLGERDPGVAAAIFAGNRTMTNDDVLQSILDRNEQEGSK